MAPYSHNSFSDSVTTIFIEFWTFFTKQWTFGDFLKSVSLEILVKFQKRKRIPRFMCALNLFSKAVVGSISKSQGVGRWAPAATRLIVCAHNLFFLFSWIYSRLTKRFVSSFYHNLSQGFIIMSQNFCQDLSHRSVMICHIVLSRSVSSFCHDLSHRSVMIWHRSVICQTGRTTSLAVRGPVYHSCAGHSVVVVYPPSPNGCRSCVYSTPIL